MVILFTNGKSMSGSMTLRDRFIYLCKEWDNVKALNDIITEKQMYDYVTEVMLKDIKERS